ncbi:MAG: PQQ-like beta-propeller repeat protein [Deltaproteobacteria bacterium]|nr:PQQ-like beta-propeller repeat protein [Deltaproteobacteria bacterium]
MLFGHPRQALTALLVLISFGGVAAAESSDWPQWRGPQRNGHGSDTGLLQSWPEAGPPLAWKKTGLGGGFSSVAVAGDKIFTMGDLGDAQYVLALDRHKGAHLWKVKIGPSWEDQYLGPRSTPTVDGNRVYALGTEGTLLCLDSSTGKIVWQRSLIKDFGGRMMSVGDDGTYNWKFSESPLIDGDRILVTPGGPQAAVVALDKNSGKEIWRTALPKFGSKGLDGAGYSSIVISNGGGVRQYIQLLGRGLIGLEAKTGRFLWGYDKVANEVANIPTPLVQGDYIFASSGYGTGAALLRLTQNKTGVQAEEVYFLTADTFQNHHGGMILKDGYVYAGTGHNKGFPIAVELATGKIAWGPERNKGSGSAAVAYADGHLYLRYQNGLMVLAEATLESYREKGSFPIPDAEKPSWPHPVIAGGMLYLREQDTLLVYDLVAPKPPKAAAEKDQASTR